MVICHTLPNSLGPIAAVTALMLAQLILGVVVVETVFAYPGLGQLLIDSVSKRDVTVVQGICLIFACVYVLMNLIADLVSIMSNPRILHPKTAEAMQRTLRTFLSMTIGARLSVVFLLLLVVMALLAPLIAPYGETEIAGSGYDDWGRAHLFGTDSLGRDIFSRLIFGARNTIGIALLGTTLAVLFGAVLGVISATFGGAIDQLIGRSFDMLIAIPQLVLALLVLAILGTSVQTLIGVIAVVDPPASIGWRGRRRWM